MAKFTFGELVADGDVISAKLSGALTDADIGKPVKLTAADTYGLCADGDVIEGFLNAINPGTVDGALFGSIQTGGFKAVELDGAVAIGAAVEAAAPAAEGTAEANGLGKVSTHTVLATDMFIWRLVSGTAADGDTTAIITKC